MFSYSCINWKARGLLLDITALTVLQLCHQIEDILSDYDFELKIITDVLIITHNTNY